MYYLLTAALIYFLQDLRYHILRPVVKEKRPCDAEAWRVFIEANIASCRTEEHCFTTVRLIENFGNRYKDELPHYILNIWIDNLCTRVDKKFKAIKAQDYLSDVTVDELFN